MAFISHELHETNFIIEILGYLKLLQSYFKNYERLLLLHFIIYLFPLFVVHKHCTNYFKYHQ